MRTRAVIGVLLAYLCAATKVAAAIPSFEVTARDCMSLDSDHPGTSTTRLGKGFAVRAFAPIQGSDNVIRQPSSDDIWVVTALHVVNGCKIVDFRRLRQQAIVASTDDATGVDHADSGRETPALAAGPIVWRDRDLIAFPLVKASAALRSNETPGVVEAVSDPSALQNCSLTVWTNGRGTADEKRYVRSQNVTLVSDLKDSLEKIGVPDRAFGSINETSTFVEYSSDVGDGDSGAAVTVTNDPQSQKIVGVHLAGASVSGVLPRCWSLVFTTDTTREIGLQVASNDLKNGLKYHEPLLGKALVFVEQNENRRATSSTWLKLGLAIGGGLVVLGAAGATVLSLEGDSAMTRLSMRCPSNCTWDLDTRQRAVNESHIHELDQWQMRSWVVAGAGGVIALAATVVWFVRETGGGERWRDPGAVLKVSGSPARFTVTF